MPIGHPALAVVVALEVVVLRLDLNLTYEGALVAQRCDAITDVVSANRVVPRPNKDVG